MTSRKRHALMPPLTESSSTMPDFSEYTFSRPARRVIRNSSLSTAGTSYLSHCIDNGDWNIVCEFCDALFWYDERCVSRSANCRPKYTQCCKGGKVTTLPYPRTPPADVISLFERPDFLSNIRAYNSMFSMTSFGAKVDEKVNNGGGPYVFKIEGQIHHWLGSMCPPPNERPRFLQMYIYDTENEVSNRMGVFSLSEQARLSAEIVSFIIGFLEASNELVKLFRVARDLCVSSDVPNFRVCLYGSRHALSYDTPSPGTLGAILLDDDFSCADFDIVIHHTQEGPQRINKLHPLYMSLQYPLLFLYGESGWSPKMSLRVPSTEKERRLTVNMYYSYLLHDRFNLHTHLLRGGRLLQQFIVDAYVCIEQGRLDYARQNQKTLRSEFLQGHDAVQQGDIEGKSIGKRTILPSSFVGGPRYMYRHYLDALAICRVHGNPQYFITFTYNVKWPEIQRYMSQYPWLKPEDRPDIIARIFQIKVLSLIKFLKLRKPFGQVVADLYTIVFQKRGLPHCHMLLWVTEACKIKQAEDVDKYISAEIPDPNQEPELYKIVTKLMIHGPCGVLRPNSPCMSNGICSKKYPKEYHENTFFDKDGYARYKRRALSHIVNKNGILLDNRFVMPYNPTLSLHFAAHINVEYCGWSRLIKYLFKCISKGSDRVRYKIQRTVSSADEDHQGQASIDEIKKLF